MWNIVDQSPQVSQLKSFQEMADKSHQTKQSAQLQSLERDNSILNAQPVQKKENNTGLTDPLKSGMENLSELEL